jgi:glycolate dehydrogenase iron-sulfur subunit
VQTRIAQEFAETPEGREADAILRSCVHCGFCTATCPTYRLLGDELDGPRGRIYLIKQVLEGSPVGPRTRLHLDRCLGCRACETSCPSGVRYGRLADIGRELVADAVPRGPVAAAGRYLLRRVVPHPRRFGALLALANAARGLLPEALRRRVPERRAAGRWPKAAYGRRMLVLAGCVQSVVTPATNAAAARVLDRLGIGLGEAGGAGCCGAVSHHLAASDEARAYARANIDAWWPHLEAGAEAVVVTAGGCGTMVKEYGDLLAGDPDYAERARRVSEVTRDLAEVVAAEGVPPGCKPACGPVAYQSPCSIQHAQRLDGVVEKLLGEAGFTLTPVPDAHQCCGSAGTYSLLEPELAGHLLARKLAALATGGPAVIATANVGCQLHLETRAAVPVRHWIELVDEALR